MCSACSVQARSRRQTCSATSDPAVRWCSTLWSPQLASYICEANQGQFLDQPGNPRLFCKSQLLRRHPQGLQLEEIPQQATYQLRHELSSKILRTVAAIAAVASCLHSGPALADTAAQGAEQIAKSLSSSNGAIGRLRVSASTCLLNVPLHDSPVPHLLYGCRLTGQ